MTMIISLLVVGSVILSRYAKISALKYQVLDKQNTIDELDNDIKVKKVELDAKTSSKLMEELAKKQGMIYKVDENTVYMVIE